MSDEKIYTHWRAMFKNKYMGPHSLASNCNGVSLTIDSVNGGMEKGSDGTDVEGIVIHFKESAGWILPLWCGKHQCEMIVKAMRDKLKTNAVYPEKWIGFKVELAVFTEKWFGATDEYLRIHKLAKVEKVVLSPDMESWSGAVEAIINESCTLEDVTSKRQMLPEHIIQLQTDVELKKQESTTTEEENKDA